MAITINNIIMIGPMGAGKSTVGKQLAKKLNLVFYDTDELIQQRSGVDITWIFDVEGEDGYRRRENEVIEEILTHNRILLSTGGGAVILKENRDIMSNKGFVIYLKTSIQEQVQRTARNQINRPLLRGENAEETISTLMEELHPLYSEIADLTIETDQQTVRSVVDKILEEIDRV